MTYDYECPGCGDVRSIERSINAPEETYICTQCDCTFQRKWSSPPVTFKGAGFYTTDYKH